MYTVIVGCGRVGAELARLLSVEGHDVVIIDQKEASFERLGNAFNGVTLKGNGVSVKTLEDAGIKHAGIFCALTNTDNINIMASQVAKKIFKVPRVIARVYDPRKADIYRSLGLDVLSGTTLFAAMIRDKIIDKNLSSYLIETGELGMLEITVPKSLSGKRVDDLNIAGELIVTTLQRPGKAVIIPEASTNVGEGDLMVAVVKMNSVSKVKQIFQMETE